MRKTTLYIALLSCLYLLAGCEGENTSFTSPQGITTINIDVDKAKKDADITHMYDTSWYKVTALENHSDATVGGQIKKIFYRGNYLYIWEAQSKSIFKFDDEGRYVARISSYGEGPDDYMGMTSVYMTDDYIYVFDQMKRKILYYDTDCVYKGRITLTPPSEGGYVAHDFFVVGDRIFLANKILDRNDEYSTHKIASINMQGDDICCHLPMSKDETIPYRMYLHGQNYMDINGTVHFMCSSLDSIYATTIHGAEAKYALDFGENSLPKEKTGISPMELIKPENDKYVKGIKQLVETDRYMILFFEYGRLPRFSPQTFEKETGNDPVKGEIWMRTKWPTIMYHLIYDKTTDKSLLANGMQVEHFGLYRTGIRYADGNHTFDVAYPSSTGGIYEGGKHYHIPQNPAYEAKLNETYSSLTLHSNPMIIIHRMK